MYLNLVKVGNHVITKYGVIVRNLVIIGYGLRVGYKTLLL
jgi:acetyltransferase-like isoleucine patch superfamily enzyme